MKGGERGRRKRPVTGNETLRTERDTGNWLARPIKPRPCRLQAASRSRNPPRYDNRLISKDRSGLSGQLHLHRCVQYAPDSGRALRSFITHESACFEMHTLAWRTSASSRIFDHFDDRRNLLAAARIVPRPKLSAFSGRTCEKNTCETMSLMLCEKPTNCRNCIFCILSKLSVF